MTPAHAFRAASLLLLAILTGCVSQPLKPGVANADAVLRQLGPPALEWMDPDGSRQLAYPSGPFGVHTHMVRIAPDGMLHSIENVLTEEHFARIKPGMTMEEVLRLLGPVASANDVTYFERRDELVWEWLYCSNWHKLTRFHVLFDGTTGKVRSTMSLMDLECERFRRNGCWCSR